MIFSESSKSIILILVLFIFIVLLFATLLTEGFEAIPIVKDPNTKKIINGYYQVDDTQMATIPYGYIIDPNNPRQIIPHTQSAIRSLIPAKNKLYPTGFPPVPKKGDMMPDGFYLKSETSLAVLPPNMSPNIEKISFSENPTKLLVYYKPGYISQTQYYANKYTPEKYPSTLTREVYYADESKKLISFLPEGEIADSSKGYGKTKNPKSNLSTTEYNFKTSNYRNVKDNYAAQFHDDVSDIIKNNKLYDFQYEEIKVKDKDGKIVILPKPKSQGTTTFYKPGEYKFSASKYIPNYEDSIYLSSVGHRTMFGNGNTSSKSCDGMVKEYKEFKKRMEKYQI
jgi:hypothetical protein